MTFLTQFFLGSQGMPRRYYNYLRQYPAAARVFDLRLLGAGHGPVHHGGLSAGIAAQADGRARQSLGRHDAGMADFLAADRA